MMVWLAVCTSMSTVLANDAGHPSCPCIDALGTGHGAACSPWHRELPECGGASPAEWCSDEWCFVDESCERLPKLWPDDEVLHFSYATCGNIDHRHSDHAAMLASNVLRISFPGSWDGASLVTVSEGETPALPGTDRAGFMVSFAAHVFEKYNVSWEEVPMSAAASTAQPGSSYSACAYDVALNNTDMCIGDFWPTPERRRLGCTFTIPMVDETFQIIQPKESSSEEWTFVSVLGSLRTIFEPFSSGVWTAVVLVLLLVVLTMTLISEGGTNEDVSREGEYVVQCASRSADSVFAACLAMPEGAGRMNATSSWSSMLLVVGMAWAFLVLNTQYTAQVTTSAITTQYAFRNLDEVIDKKLKICIFNPGYTQLSQIIPRGKHLIVPTGDNQADAIDAGKCSVGVEGSLALDVVARSEHHCNTKTLLPYTVFSLPNSYAVRYEWEPAISWAVQLELTEGWMSHFEREAKEQWLSPAMCDLANNQEAQSQLTLRNGGMGPVVLLALTCLLTVMIKVLGLLSPKLCGNLLRKFQHRKARALERWQAMVSSKNVEGVDLDSVVAVPQASLEEDNTHKLVERMEAMEAKLMERFEAMEANSRRRARRSTSNSRTQEMTAMGDDEREETIV